MLHETALCLCIKTGGVEWASQDLYYGYRYECDDRLTIISWQIGVKGHIRNLMNFTPEMRWISYYPRGFYNALHLVSMRSLTEGFYSLTCWYTFKGKNVTAWTSLYRDVTLFLSKDEEALCLARQCLDKEMPLSVFVDWVADNKHKGKQ